MKLTQEQIAAFRRGRATSFFPGCFSEQEVALLRSEADGILASHRQEVWREKTGAPRHRLRGPHLQRGFPA